jgi:hypothetical protein
MKLRQIRAIKEDLVLKVLNMLHDAEVEAEYCSPNFVADFAYNRRVSLQSEEIVLVSNCYGETFDPTGRGVL